ncbi:hypothetical protein TSACC_22335 [Terrimicrobium sacchariphilum]|uniref:DUF1444 family protein n=2 Tax=Terrimicrobium sacchariphilum TaxID=690879 RepID=A0A146GAQ8_TERSA|nr:hypothetical protein TSACC_22335 [Terrimicrobium sacchariphilum]
MMIAQAEEPWRLLIEPSYEPHDAEWPIPGAERTVLVPARLVDGEISPLKRTEIKDMGVTRKDILAQAIPAASAILKELKPNYIRDANGVIAYAMIQSDSPLTASAVLAPEFPTMFDKKLGPDVIVAIPSRHVIYIFPKLSSISQDMAEEVILEYEASPYPVSRELFSFVNGRFVAVGRYR